MIIVTPYIVRPVSDPAAIHLPTEDAQTPNDVERIVQGREIGAAPPAMRFRLPGDAGFIVQ